MLLGLAVTDVALRAAAALHAGAVLIEPSFLCNAELDAARGAAATLNARFASHAAVAGIHSVDSSIRDCETLDLLENQVWARLPSGLGRIVAKLDDLRGELALSTGRPLLESTELQLLTYTRQGGHYVRHVDEGPTNMGERSVRRSISLLLYLTPDDWRQTPDGGMLRIHPTSMSNRVRAHCRRPGEFEGTMCIDETISDAAIDVLPAAGTLVLFDSSTIPHEVLPTARERSVVVGWLLEKHELRS
mmetsp:Transcript_31160/g.81467  ORF Transcript_31160/g.81467 Transcript_31160/m.81467 type:complete len:246 (+) Transcript_31160:36-773(+)